MSSRYHISTVTSSPKIVTIFIEYCGRSLFTFEVKTNSLETLGQGFLTFFAQKNPRVSIWHSIALKFGVFPTYLDKQSWIQVCWWNWLTFFIANIVHQCIATLCQWFGEIALQSKSISVKKWCHLFHQQMKFHSIILLVVFITELDWLLY